MAGPLHLSAAVLVPVKAFGAAKARLSDVLDGAARADLARAMATHVVAAAAPLPALVVCDHDDVAAWAAEVGAEVVWTPGLGLDGAVEAGISVLDDRGVDLAIVTHADLPFAAGLATLTHGLGPDGDADVALVPDRHHDGTNIAVVPTGCGFRFSYGAASLQAHVAEAGRLDLRVRIVESEPLGWDVDRPADLDPPAHLGTVPVRRDDGVRP